MLCAMWYLYMESPIEPLFQSLFYWTSERDLDIVGLGHPINILFQSLFYWTSERDGGASGRCWCSPRVSILILLDFWAGHNYLPVLIIHNFVSILILLDFWAGQSVNIVVNHCIVMFQSLFYWTSERDYGKDVVSFSSIGCFNPYFTGLLSGTLISMRWKNSWPSFNPYFTGLLSGTNADGWLQRDSSGFQSLFYWTSERDCGISALSRLKSRSFNPYFTGLLSGTR